jgi:hypothetical protein
VELFLTVGSNLDDVTTTSGTLAGLPVSEKPESDECVEDIATQATPLTGIEVVAKSSANPCIPARAFATAIINRVRGNPPQRSNTNGSLALIDPCTTVEDGTAATTVGGTPQKIDKGLFQCGWQGGNGVTLTVSFYVGDDPKNDTSIGTIRPVDLDGINAYQTPNPEDNAGCAIRWATRSTGPHDVETVDIRLQNQQHQQADLCATTFAVAKVVATKVPKPS